MRKQSNLQVCITNTGDHELGFRHISSGVPNALADDLEFYSSSSGS